MIPGDAPLLAFIAVLGVLELIMLGALYHALLGHRADARARDRRHHLDRQAAQPPARREVGFRTHRRGGDVAGVEDGREPERWLVVPPAEPVIYCPDKGDDAAGVVRERAR